MSGLSDAVLVDREWLEGGPVCDLHLLRSGRSDSSVLEFAGRAALDGGNQTDRLAYPSQGGCAPPDGFRAHRSVRADDGQGPG